MVALFFPFFCLAVFVGIIIVSAIIVVIYFALEEMKGETIINIRWKGLSTGATLFFMSMCVLCLIVAVYYLVTPFYLP